MKPHPFNVWSGRRIWLGIAILILATTAPVSAVEMKVVTPKELWALFVKLAVPQYPYEARRAHLTGSGIFRIYVNPDGSVRTVGVMKSTGSPILDLAAAGGLFHSTLKPGRRREIDMPVTFTMGR